LRLLRPCWRRLGLPRAELFSGPVDVVHSIALHPAPTRKPSIQTIHDVLPITHPGLYPEESREVHRQELESASRASIVVTTCEATAGEIARVADVPRDRIVVASPGAFLARVDVSPAPPNERYLLAVGQVTPRKGLDVLARAAAILGERCPPILVAGPDWWGSEQVRADIARLDTARRITLLGNVEDARLAALYRGATIVCHASRAEGFGMTCLEAMAAGIPLVASDLPSVRELTGGSALIVPVEDAESLAAAVSSLLEDEEQRQGLARAGRERAGGFTWPGMAERVVAAYRRAVGS
jgi:glycosyltransferase involved in cell wall biosynthesis